MEDGEVLECADVEENKVEENKVEENKFEDKPRKKNEQHWKKYQNMSVEEKRKYYKCGDGYVQIKDIETWPEFFQENGYMFSKIQKRTKMEKPDFLVNEYINNKISLWEGDITRLEIDAIVNAANRSLLGGGGVDGCIHRAAGKTLVEECRLLNGCDTGDAKITSGHKLPAKHVIHTVGPIGGNEKDLKSCYKKCLKVALENEVRTLAFCCISTGIYGYPNRDAAEVALRTTRKWLEDEDNARAVDRIIFCLFLEKDIHIYHALMLKYFPPRELKKPTKKSDKTAIPVKSEEDEETRKKEPKKEDANHKDEDSRSESDENLEAEAGKGNKEMETEEYKEKDEKKVASTLEDSIETAEGKEKLGSDEEMKRVEQLQKGSEGILEDGGDNNPSKAEEIQTGEENVSKEKKKEEETQMGRKVKENDNSMVENPTSKKQKQDNVNEGNKSQDAEMTEVESPEMKEQKTAEEKEQD